MMSLVSVLGCGTWVFLIEEQLYYVLSKEGSMEDAGTKVIDLIFGRKRSQMLYVGVTLGVFDALAHGPRSAARACLQTPMLQP
jgi:hypothetical protein